MDTEARLKIGFLLNFNKNWLGGIYYVLNIIRTLNWLEDEDKPKIYLFYNPGLRNYIDEVKYSHLEAIEWHFPSVPGGFFRSVLKQKNLFVSDIVERYEPDCLYPVWDFPVKEKNKKTRFVGWFADLQHKHYPSFFSIKQRIMREARLKFMIMNADSIVVSSNAVAKDFAAFYRPLAPLEVYHFVSVIDSLSHDFTVEQLKERYRLTGSYFIVSNQFHKHKNHKVVLEAAGLLKQKGCTIRLAITGKLPARSDSVYIAELHELIDRYEMNDTVRFLGVLPRAEQLCLMQYAEAVIQPSLFEGWSTVIEDAISLQAPVIASNLPVNIEQLGPDGVYFDPYDAEGLAAILENYPSRNLEDVFYEKYENRIRKAAYRFIEIFKSTELKKENVEQEA